MRIAITRHQGRVACALLERGRTIGIEVVPLARPKLDLTRPDTILPALATADADRVGSSAAFTAVDLAESQPELAFALNGRCAGAVSSAAATLKIPVVQLSADYIFEGACRRPYVETNPIHPINVCIADALLVVARQLLNQPAAAELHGVFHMVGDGEATYPEFAEGIFALQTRRAIHLRTWGIFDTSAFPTPAARPANSLLDSCHPAAVYTFAYRHRGSHLPAYVRRMLGETR